MVAVEDAKVGQLGPWLQSLINSDQKPDILSVVVTHERPGFGVTVHATSPKMDTRVFHFTPAAKIARKIIELIGIEFERAPGDLEGIYTFEGGRWLEPMDYKASIDFFEIK